MKALVILMLSSALLHAHFTVGLEVNHRSNPLGDDDPSPRLEWRMIGDEKGLMQSAYQVMVASDAEVLAKGEPDLWDSGKQLSADTFVRYAGEPLPSSDWVYWRVRTWSGENVSEWSQIQRYLTGRIGSQPKQPYIAFKDTTPFHTTRKKLYLPPTRYYRSTFKPKGKVVQAVAHASALGIYDFHVNGKRVGDSYFSPGWTDYRQRAYYNTYDLTSLLVDGENAVGAVVADGWYAGYVGYGKLVGYGPYQTGRNIYGKTPALMVELHLTYEDGSKEVVGTDTSWKSAIGPELEADFLMGETYDARRELTGWSTPSYDDSTWGNVVLAKSNGSELHPFKDRFVKEKREFGFVRPPVLQAYPAQPVRVTDRLSAKSVKRVKPGVWIFDMGQNFAGVVELKVKAKRGQKFVMRFGEMLHPDGRLMTENLREARATDTYIAKGDPKGETWSPRFTFHGFQFVELTGVDEKPSLDTVTGLVLNSDVELTSGFESSDSMLTKLVQNAIWTQRANWLELPTDCPQRDERLGWTGDAQIYAVAAMIHADGSAFIGKWLRELEEARTQEGYYPSYAPYCFGHGGAVHGTGWSDAGIIVPYAMWQATGDTSFFVDHWKAMTQFMRARKAHDPQLKGKAFGAPWGDWLNLNDSTPNDYMELAYFARCAVMMNEMSLAQGLEGEANMYQDWLGTMRDSFRKRFLKAGARIDPESQTAYALALECGLLNDATERRQAASNLAKLILAKASDKNTGITTGFLGTKSLLYALTENGQHDLAMQIVQSRKFPSWGYEIKNGATSIWERWNSYTTEHGFGGPDGKMSAAMNSFSHYAFGAVTAWMFHHLAGIEPAVPGYAKIRLAPKFPSAEASGSNPPLTWVKAHHDSPHGRIAVSWKKLDDGSLSYEATVPPNTTAELILPVRSPWKKQESKTEVRQLQPGTHQFIVK